jgi:hypothetical protein
VTGASRAAGRLQLVLVAAVFIGPLLLAGWLYYRGTAIQPEGRSNHGSLLEPVINVHDELPDTQVFGQAGRLWLLVYADERPCETACRDALYVLRQSRKMLGRDMDRLGRVFLHGESAPDTVFLAGEHAGLITIREPGLYRLLNDKKPAALPAGGYYLIDPLGNLVMYFRPDIDPSDMVDDIRHLLRLSHIG